MLPRLQLLLAATLFSTGGAAIKMVSLSGWQVACFRAGIAAMTVGVLVPRARRVWDPRVLAVASTFAATMVLFVVANKLTTSANSIFLQSTAPLYIVLLGPLLLGERVRSRELVLVVLVAVGLLPFVLVTDPASRTAPDPARGNLVAMVSGMTWAAAVMGMRWLAQRSAGDSGPAVVLLANLLACLFCLPLALPIHAGTTADWTTLAFLGVFQIGVAYLCLTAGMRRVPALEASILLLAEPALNPIWSWLVHGERPGAWAAAGGSLILGASCAQAWLDGGAQTPSEPKRPAL